MDTPPIRTKEMMDVVREQAAAMGRVPSLREVCSAYENSASVPSEACSTPRRGPGNARLPEWIHESSQANRPLLDIPILPEIPEGSLSRAVWKRTGCLTADPRVLRVTAVRNTFALKAPDDSLASVHVRKGDLVVFDQGVEPATGDIVAAFVDGSPVLGVYEQQGPHVVLKAAGDAAPVVASAECVKGVMVTLIRRVPESGNAA
ncbi:MAG: hypothetical protein H7A45_03295 [Verrucomicrobiales bacterium]|nr:hypothetical protein [Verrucomicrobiales bacterium]MCP5527782.1 hypothetical protein [Verrucomicrobiales bacterium]